MSFTISTAKTLAESWVDETIDATDALLWGRECLQDKIGSRAWDEATKAYTATANKWYALPSDFIRSIKVTDSIGLPAGLTVTPTGGTGTKIYGYRVTAVNAVGETAACTEVKTTTGYADLSASAYNALSWTAVTGATSYNIYRVTTDGSPATTGYIGNATAVTFNDTGIAGDGEDVPPEDTSGDGEYTGYEIRNRKIKFDDTDTYVLVYVAFPAVLSTSESLPLPDWFLYPLAKFLASRQRSFDDSEDMDAIKWMQEFDAGLSQLLNEMEMDNEVFQVKEVW